MTSDEIEGCAFPSKAAAPPNAMQVGLKGGRLIVPLSWNIEINDQIDLRPAEASLRGSQASKMAGMPLSAAQAWGSPYTEALKTQTCWTSKPRDRTSVAIKIRVLPSRNSLTTLSRTAMSMSP